MQFSKTTILDVLRICLPDYWIMVNRYDKSTEAFIQYAAENDLIRLNERDTEFCRLAVGEHEIWTCNYPYGYGNISKAWNARPSFTSYSSRGRPSRLTILKLRKLERSFAKEISERAYNRIKETVDQSVMSYNKSVKRNEL